MRRGEGAVSHASHTWQPAGTMSDGQRRYVCTACRIGRTWPEATAKCGAIAVVEVDRSPAKPKKPHASIVVGAAPNRVCAVCATGYHSKHAQSRYCSQPCAKAAWNVQHAASQKRTETPMQREARAARQRARGWAKAAKAGSGPVEAAAAATGREEAAE